ncbi:MAG: N-acetylmuramoyl-L-alanine amidase [Elusimicrobia bacterium]|nr:N-acetylmuramoyl-L-alanine amidase [Elusimicrobiota bacterium]
MNPFVLIAALVVALHAAPTDLDSDDGQAPGGRKAPLAAPAVSASTAPRAADALPEGPRDARPPASTAPRAADALPEGPRDARPPASTAPAPTPAPVEPLPGIRLVYPSPNERVGSLRRIFVFGSVHPATGTLTINGLSAPLTDLGQFLKTIPVDPGTFTIRLELRTEGGLVESMRDIFVSSPAGPPPPGKAAVVPVQPEADLWLKGGDWVKVAAWANPGGKMRFRIKGLAEDVPMAEAQGPGSGVYYAENLKETFKGGGYYVGAYRVAPGDMGKDRPIEFQFKHPGFGKAKATAPGRLTTDPRWWRVAQVQAKAAPARSGPDDGYLYFFQQGTRLLLDAKEGLRWRIRLADTEEAWIEEKYIELLPEGTPPPSAKLETVVVRSGPAQTDVEFLVNAAIPVVVAQEGDDVVKVSFYQTREHVNYVVYDEDDPFVRDIRWRQENAQKASVLIALAEGEKLWGYALRRAADRTVLTLRRPPSMGRKTVFEGLTIALDPGHSGPDAASTGPLMTREQDVNYALAQRVRKRLLEEKAEVVMTRGTPEEVVGLSRRPELAVEAKADLFLSLHFNALPPGVDPRDKPRGYSVYYYHPQSFDLARELLLSYRDKIQLPSESFRFGDYLVVRMTEMPAALIESAYIMLPEQEKLITDPRFQDKLAQAIVEGLWRFLAKNLRPVSPPSKPASRR